MFNRTFDGCVDDLFFHFAYCTLDKKCRDEAPDGDVRRLRSSWRHVISTHEPLFFGEYSGVMYLGRIWLLL